MSLSKYYKDSSSFKREDIVKKGSQQSQGWTTEPKAPSEPFTPGKIERNSLELKNSSRHPENRQTVEPGTPTSPSEPSVPPQNQPPAPSEPEIDLSNYVSIEEAEQTALLRFQEGVQEGLAKAAEDYSSATKAFITSCEQLDLIRETIINNSNKELLQFALLIAEKVLRISIKEQDHTIVATIEEALHRAVKSDEFTIFINPDDYDKIAAKTEELIASVSGLNNIVLKTDPTVEIGGAKIESENCIIDATVSSQFEAIREELYPDKTS